MMNTAFREILLSSAKDRRDLYVSTARRLGTSEQNVEKDFWVCWTLDALFNGLPAGGPRFLFKGGTSLSKGFGLIERFSEDIDITVFRDDIGHAVSIAELESLSGKKRRTKLDEIRAACQTYIKGELHRQLGTIVARELESINRSSGEQRLLVDEEDPDGQSLIFSYPSVMTADEYVRPAVKIEAGAKSALDPNAPLVIKPYIADDVPQLALSISGVTTVDASRTFWDKITILHGLRRWFDHRGELRQEGRRISRHYYDVYKLLGSAIGQAAILNIQMGSDCARHARMFFNRPDFDLDEAAPGTLTLMPHDKMIGALRADYVQMSGMIFGSVPAFEAVLASIADIESSLNKMSQT
jgi:hypothetical protein